MKGNIIYIRRAKRRPTPHILLTAVLGLGLLLFVSSCGFMGSSLQTFIDDDRHYDSGVWSPNGRWFAAAVYDDTTPRGEDIHLYSKDGKHLQTLSLACHHAGIEQLISWRTATEISCWLAPTNLRRVIQTVQLDVQGQPTDKKEQMVLPYDDGTILQTIAWNPQHPWLATMGYSTQSKGQLYLLDQKGHTLAGPLPVDTPQAAWSPDGTQLALTHQNGDVQILSVQPKGDEEIETQTLRTLQVGASETNKLAWSPNGHWLLCRHGTYESEDYLFLIAADGTGKPIKLTSSYTEGQVDGPAWSPDGKWLIVAKIEFGGNPLMKIDMEKLLKEKGIKL